VYLDHNRHTAILLKSTPQAVWYITLRTGQITFEHCGIDHFERDWPFMHPDYPLRRALTAYQESYLSREAHVDNIIRTALRRL
jgi:hypothetical protein